MSAAVGGGRGAGRPGGGGLRFDFGGADGRLPLEGMWDMCSFLNDAKSGSLCNLSFKVEYSRLVHFMKLLLPCKPNRGKHIHIDHVLKTFLIKDSQNSSTDCIKSNDLCCPVKVIIE